jgi:hypothetical protein
MVTCCQQEQQKQQFHSLAQLGLNWFVSRATRESNTTIPVSTTTNNKAKMPRALFIKMTFLPTTLGLN